MYAFKGMAGRFAPIGVHLAMLLIMGGATLTAAGSFKGSITVPQGLNFVVGDVMNPTGFLSNALDSFSTEIHVNRFYMDYYDSGEVRLSFAMNFNFPTFSFFCFFETIFPINTYYLPSIDVVRVMYFSM